ASNSPPHRGGLENPGETLTVCATWHGCCSLSAWGLAPTKRSHSTARPLDVGPGLGPTEPRGSPTTWHQLAFLTCIAGGPKAAVAPTCSPSTSVRRPSTSGLRRPPNLTKHCAILTTRRRSFPLVTPKTRPGGVWGPLQNPTGRGM